MEKEFYQLSKVEPVMRRTLENGGVFPFYPHGISMLPLIREDRDQVILSALPEKPEKYQIILYKRKNGAFVLHRIVGISKKGSQETYTMRGDHQYQNEYGIAKEQMIGVVSWIVKAGKTVDAQHGFEYAKAVFWVNTVKVRQGLSFIRRCGSKVKRIFFRR